MHFVSVVLLTKFLFPLRLQMYHLTISNVPPVVHVPQVGNPWYRLYLAHHTFACSVHVGYTTKLPIIITGLRRKKLIFICTIVHVKQEIHCCYKPQINIYTGYGQIFNSLYARNYTAQSLSLHNLVQLLANMFGA